MQNGIHLELGQNMEANFSPWERGKVHISVITGHQFFNFVAQFKFVTEENIRKRWSTSP